MTATVSKNQVKVKLDKVRVLHYTLNSLIALEEALGVPISELGTVKLSVKNIRSFLYHGLTHEDELITEEEVGELVSLDNLSEVQEKIAEAFDKVNPKKS
jgi:hypothetical protein